MIYAQYQRVILPCYHSLYLGLVPLQTQCGHSGTNTLDLAIAVLPAGSPAPCLAVGITICVSHHSRMPKVPPLGAVPT